MPFAKLLTLRKFFWQTALWPRHRHWPKNWVCKTATNAEVAGDCDLIFLAVKPQMMEALLQPLKFTFDERPSRFVLCSMAGGPFVARIQEMAGEDFPVIRIMPNTPASVGEGMIQYCSSNVTAEEEEAFLRIMAPAGRLDAVPESLIDAASCVFRLRPGMGVPVIEALADGGVACGLPRAKAQEYAAQMVLGSAKLVLESGKASRRTQGCWCAAPAAAPFRACACWKSTACAVR